MSDYPDSAEHKSENFLPSAAKPCPAASAAQPAMQKRAVPSYETLQERLSESSELVNDIILKQYLANLSQYEVIPPDESLCRISDVRLFKITEMVYQKDEYSTYKFASVFNAVQNLNCVKIGKPLTEMTLAEMDELWNEAKLQEKE